jgi:hypothetical protein
MQCPPADSSAAGMSYFGPEPEMSVETLRRSQRPRACSEKRRSVPKIAPLPGRLYAERKRCNRPNCRCVAGGDALHGPYLFRRWVENGRRRRQYVKASDADQVRAGLAAWRQLHPPVRSTRDLLAELRRLLRQVVTEED